MEVGDKFVNDGSFIEGNTLTIGRSIEEEIRTELAVRFLTQCATATPETIRFFHKYAEQNIERIHALPEQTAKTNMAVVLSVMLADDLLRHLEATAVK